MSKLFSTKEVAEFLKVNEKMEIIRGPGLVSSWNGGILGFLRI